MIYNYRRIKFKMAMPAWFTKKPSWCWHTRAT